MKSKNHALAEETNVSSFEQFGLKPELLTAVTQAGFTVPSAIQEKVIPHILAGKDVVGQAKTGTGKTAAFGLPALSMMNPKSKKTELLVITPTRELATQVCDEIQRFGKHLGFKSASICGGRAYSKQIDDVQRGAQVVVATPGRLLDLLTSKRIPALQPSIVVLDEADEMLDMGFLEDIKEIFTFLPEERQTLLFSATMPMQIKKLAQKILKDPEFVSVEQNGDMTQQNITQRAFALHNHEREDALIRLLDSERPFKSIVFCRTRSEVDRLQSALQEQGYKSASLHGDLEQRQRERVTDAFKSGQTKILVATDVASRGLNVPDITHVFNYQLPSSSESYVHRIGRTARAGKLGCALTFFTPDEYHKLNMIQKAVGCTIRQEQVPSLSSLQKNRILDLVNKIKTQPLNKDAEALWETLQNEADHDELFQKLISMFLNQQTCLGPENIGISKDNLGKMSSSSKPSSRPRRGGFGGRSGGGRSGGRSEGGGGSRFSRSGPPGRSFRSDRPERSDRPDRSERSDRPARSDKPRPFKSDKPRPFKSDKPAGKPFGSKAPRKDTTKTKRPKR